MSATPLDLPAELIDAVQSQNAILFLGAAASVGAIHPRGDKIPDGKRLRDLLADRFLGGQGKEKPLATVAEYAINEAGLVRVQQFIGELLREFRPADFHFLIPQFRWHGIATTNFDLIIEQAYDPSQSPLQELVPYFKDGQHIETEMKKAVNGVTYIKLHGSIDHYTDEDIPLILSSEQYSKYRLHRERLFYRFQNWGHEFPIIFCGYSVSDPNIQSILFNLFDENQKRPMYYIVGPDFLPVEERYWASRRTTPIRATFEQFLKALDAAVTVVSRALPKSIGGGSSSLRAHYKVSQAPETQALFSFLADDAYHVHIGMPISPVVPKEFYRGEDNGWGAISQSLDIPRAITDSLVVDAVLADEKERSGRVDLYAVKGPAGNGKTIVLMRAAWMAACDYEKVVLFLKPGGTIRNDVIEEIHRYTKERIFVFVDKAALYVDEIRSLIEFAKSKDLPLTIILAERDAEWNVRCEALDKYAFRDFPVRYLSERAIRTLLAKLEQHDSLGLLGELPNFEDRVQRLMSVAQRQLLVALHEATLGKAFEDIVYEEYQRIIPPEAQTLYLDICSLNRLGVGVRAGLISRVSGIEFVDFEKQFFKPLAHIVRSRRDKYSGDMVYTARHEHVAEMVFDRVLSDPEARYNQMIRVMGGLNLDYSSDATAFSQMVRGHSIFRALKSRELGRTFFEVACKVAPQEAFIFQQRGVFEMDSGELMLAEKYLEHAYSLEPHNKSIQHSLVVLARRQALETPNQLLRQRIRDRARAQLAPLLRESLEHSYGYHTAAQIALDDMRDVLASLDDDKPDVLLQRRLVDLAQEFERHVQEGFQKSPMNEHLLALEADYRTLMHQRGAAKRALEKAFAANPRQDWIAIRLAKNLEGEGDLEGAQRVLLRCIQDNPTSKRVHYELALFYMHHPKDPEKEKELIYEHLRRSFTVGDQNYEAQFWYARQAFLIGKAEAKAAFAALENAPIPPQLRNQARGIITDAKGGTKIYVGEVITLGETYMFVRCAEFSENIFIHRSVATNDEWRHFRRGDRVTFSVGFNMRGPTGGTVRRLQ